MTLRATLRASLLLLAAPSAQAKLMTVSAADKSIEVSIDSDSGAVTSLTARGTQHAVSASTTLEGTIPLQVSAAAVKGGVLVSRLVCIHAEDVPCSDKQALVQELYTTRPTSVGWTVNISSPTDPTVPTPLWSGAAVTNVTFAVSGDKQFWAPWERNNAVNPLSPSDGGYSWWTGEYLLGAEVMKAPDHVIHEMATVLDPEHDAGVSFIPNPANPPALPTWLNISAQITSGGGGGGGGGGSGCKTPHSCVGPGSFAVSRHNLRFGDYVAPHIFDSDIVAHEACWRAALGWSAERHAPYWEPVSPVIKEIEGLGSYSSYLGDLTDPKFKAMGYSLNWDLSGRFFPYAGQFLPPVQPGEVWLNDGEGTQPRANVSFQSIDEFYGRIQEQGFATLSYFNVFECHLRPSFVDRNPDYRITYGENICGDYPGMAPPCAHSGVPSAARPSSTDLWANSTLYLLQQFPKSLCTSYANAHNGFSTTPPGERKQITTWQGGVVVDPVEPKLKAHFLAQLARKYEEIPHFQGLVVDRSDWNSLYNFDYDDGASLVGNRTAHLAQYSYLDTIGALRAMMIEKQGTGATARHHNSTVMLQNALGFAQLSLMKDFDGTFSEGGIVNSVGLLGARSTAILWTYSAKECCASDALADKYFQTRLYLKVFPMAPFPQADHCIASDPKAEALYLQYGSLFKAIVGAKWLLKPHAATASAPVVVNAFEMPGAPGSATLWAVMLGGNATTASLSLRYLPPGAVVAGLEPGIQEEAFQVMHPGPGAVWQPLNGGAAAAGDGSSPAAAAAVKLEVPLVQGCALVRLKPTP